MRLNLYQEKVNEFLLETAKNREYLAVGLGAEVGEVQSLLAKAVRDSEGKVDKLKLMLELGDVLFFVATLAKHYDIELEQVATNNIVKLSDRKERNVLSGSGDNR